MKKNYATPSLEVVMIDESDLIATSDPRGRVYLKVDLDETEDDGYAD